MVRGKRDTADIMECAHDSAATGLDRGLEGDKIDVMQGLAGDLRGIVVTPAFSRAVTDKVLGAGDNAIAGKLLRDRILFISLKSLDGRSSEFAYEIGVLAEAFRHPAPAGITGDVEHWRKAPVNTIRPGLPGGNRIDRLNQLG